MSITKKQMSIVFVLCLFFGFVHAMDEPLLSEGEDGDLGYGVYDPAGNPTADNSAAAPFLVEEGYVSSNAHSDRELVDDGSTLPLLVEEDGVPVRGVLPVWIGTTGVARGEPALCCWRGRKRLKKGMEYTAAYVVFGGVCYAACQFVCDECAVGGARQACAVVGATIGLLGPGFWYFGQACFKDRFKAIFRTLRRCMCREEQA